MVTKLQFPYAEILLSVFLNGFVLNLNGPRKARFCKNPKSVAQFPDIAKQKVDKEISVGRVAGPFDYLPLTNLQVSPIGIVPKKNTRRIQVDTSLILPRGPIY